MTADIQSTASKILPGTDVLHSGIDNQLVDHICNVLIVPVADVCSARTFQTLHSDVRCKIQRPRYVLNRCINEFVKMRSIHLLYIIQISTKQYDYTSYVSLFNPSSPLLLFFLRLLCFEC